MQHHDHHGHRDDHERGAVASTANFPTATADLPTAQPTEIVELGDGEELELAIAPVGKRIGETTVRMLAYNGTVPGPTLKVRQGSTLTIHVRNDGDHETTVHWHGLRLENRYDGTHETQPPIPIGGTFTYRIECPDPGVYWYHPHIREDYGKELGLYGNILVVPAEDGYWPPADRELLLTLDDVLIEDGEIAPFARNETTYAAMGRFGNVMLTGGDTEPSFAAQPGEVVRFHLTNTANTRVFNVALSGAQLKLVGGDSGRVEHERFVDSVVMGPSERAVVDALFEQEGERTLEHRTPQRTYPLATIVVGGESAAPTLGAAFSALRHNREWQLERERLAPYVDARPDKTLAFVAELNVPEPTGAVVYACPMHPEVVSETPGKCPKCGMKLLAAPLVAESSSHAHGHGHGEHAHGHAADETEHVDSGDGGGIEWEDDMVAVNRATTSANTRWSVIDRDTGAANDAIDWTFRVGDRVKLRLVNELDSDHPMHHPFHIHGAGRFVVLARDGVGEENLVWKDTVLVRTGETVDILLDVTNPGRWMAHCHIAEHHESGMMFSFDVVDRA